MEVDQQLQFIQVVLQDYAILKDTVKPDTRLATDILLESIHISATRLRNLIGASAPLEVPNSPKKGKRRRSVQVEVSSSDEEGGQIEKRSHVDNDKRDRALALRRGRMIEKRQMRFEEAKAQYCLDMDKRLYGTDPLERRMKIGDKLNSNPSMQDSAFVEGRYMLMGETVCVICLTKLGDEVAKPACCMRGMCRACTTHLSDQWVGHCRRQRGQMGIMRCMGCLVRMNVHERVRIQVAAAQSDPACQLYQDIFLAASRRLVKPRCKVQRRRLGVVTGVSDGSDADGDVGSGISQVSDSWALTAETNEVNMGVVNEEQPVVIPLVLDEAQSYSPISEVDEVNVVQESSVVSPTLHENDESCTQTREADMATTGGVVSDCFIINPAVPEDGASCKTRLGSDTADMRYVVRVSPVVSPACQEYVASHMQTQGQDKVETSKVAPVLPVVTPTVHKHDSSHTQTPASDIANTGDVVGVDPVGQAAPVRRIYSETEFETPRGDHPIKLSHEYIESAGWESEIDDEALRAVCELEAEVALAVRGLLSAAKKIPT